MSIAKQVQSLLHKPFVQKVIQTYSTQIIAMVLGLLTTLITTRTLGPTGRGWLASAYATATLSLVFGALGFNISNSYFCSKLPDKRHLLLGNSLLASFTVTPVIGLALVLLAYYSPSLVQLPGLFLPLTLVYIATQLVIQSVQQILIAIKEVTQCNLQELTLRSIAFLLSAIIAYCGYTKPLAYFSASLVACATIAIWCSRLAFLRLGRKIGISWELAKQTAGYNFKYYLTGIMGCIYLQLDILVIQIVLGPAQTGIYSIACAIRNLLLLLPTVISSLLLPRLISDSKTPFDTIIPTVRVTLVSMAVMAAVSLCLYFVAVPLMRLVFGAEFATSGEYLILMLPALILRTAPYILRCVLCAVELPWHIFYYLTPVLLLDILLTVYWIPLYGTLGALYVFNLIACLESLAYIGLVAYYYKTLPRTPVTTPDAT